MSQHLIVVHIDGSDGDRGEGPGGERATLRDRDGHTYHVPADWLPEGAQEGTALIADIVRQESRTELVVRSVEGTTEPEGTDIGA